MIPGRVSRVIEGPVLASATAITPRDGEVFRVTGATQIETINPPLGNRMNQVIWLIPTSGAVVVGTAGNVLVGVTMAQNRAVMFVWLSSIGKWYIENGA